MKIINRIIHGLPKYIKDVWYHQTLYGNEKYPIIFNANNKYIQCTEGLKVVMGKTKDGRSIYYKVERKWRVAGSDFRYPSDAIHCDLKFDSIETIKTK